MKKNPFTWVIAGSLMTALFLFLQAPLTADEGMWTFDNPPLKQLKEKYGFEPTNAWFEHVRLASVRSNDGGSASFVSPGGLLLTNFHVALGQLQKVSSAQKNYVANGFYASTLAEELACPDLELNVLISMVPVTAQVLKAVKPGMEAKKALEARQATIAKIERDSLKQTGLRSEVATFYCGGEYWLYRYKKYTEVKLVFAPEKQTAFHGGDFDNFTYPRHDLDIALFRAYENGKPAKILHYLKVNSQGAADGELVFASGNPGSTDRLFTLAQLQAKRDYEYPIRLKRLKRVLAAFKQYAGQGTEQARQAAGNIYGIENGLKLSENEYRGLKTPGLLERKAKEEQEFRQLVNSKPEWKQSYADVWDIIAAAVEKNNERINEFTFRYLPGLRLNGIALQIVRLVAEIKKPDGQRLNGYHDSQLESLKFRLFSPAPIYPGLEEVLAIDFIKNGLEVLGAGDPFMKSALDGKTPEELVKWLLAGTKLADPAVRRALVDGGETAVAQSTDPYIILARRLDPILREMIKWQEDHIDSVARPAGEKIGQARFAVYGKGQPPDATFTLRLSYGQVKGYAMNGTKAPSKTTFYGLYDRAAGFDYQPPFNLPQRFIDFKEKVELSTPLNFVATLDTIGGSSGSPVINRSGELVGLVFDGNIEGLVNRFVYDDTAGRTVSVHIAAILEAMKKLYGAEKLVKEILGE